MEKQKVATTRKLDKKQEEQRLWSSLPPDLLRVILSRLYLEEDYDNFHAVCKAWQSITTPLQQYLPLANFDHVRSQSPLLMIGRSDNATWKFLHPVTNHIYHVDIPQLVGAHVRCALYDWLLLTRHDDPYTAFFFNPFTKEKIELPRIPLIEGYWTFKTMSFSCPPTSSNYLVVGVSSTWDPEGRIFSIGILEHGRWRIHEIKSAIPFTASRCSPILHKGLYYCLSVDGKVGLFDPKDEECKWTVRTTTLHRKLRRLHAQSFLMKNNEGLTAVFIPQGEKAVRVLQWDDSNEDWQTMKNLGNKTHFVSHGSSLSNKVLSRGMGNKIYMPMLNGQNGVFYSLDTWKYESFHDDYSSKGPYELKKHQTAIWIGPSLKSCKKWTEKVMSRIFTYRFSFCCFPNFDVF